MLKPPPKVRLKSSCSSTGGYKSWHCFSQQPLKTTPEDASVGLGYSWLEEAALAELQTLHLTFVVYYQ